jgi:hypothetical protein
MYLFGRRLTVEEFQPRTHDLLYGIYDGRQNLVGHNIVRLTAQALLQGLAPRDSQFRIDVDDVDASGNRTYEIFILCS